MSLKDLIMKNKEIGELEPDYATNEEMLKEEYINYRADNYVKIRRLNELLLCYHRDHDFVKSKEWSEYEKLQKELSVLPTIDEKLAVLYGPQGASEFKRLADEEVMKEAYKRNQLDKAYTFKSMQTMLREKEGAEDSETKEIEERFNEILTKNKILEEDIIKTFGEEKAYIFFEEIEKYIKSKTEPVQEKKEITEKAMDEENELGYKILDDDGYSNSTYFEDENL